MSAKGKARVCIAAIAGAFGVRGEVRLKCFTAEAEAVAAYGPAESEDGTARYEIRITRAVKGGLAARLSGVQTREAAEALKGTRLYVPRAALPEPEAEEFYHADLVGLEAVTPEGERLGPVKAVHDFGAGDLLEIGQARAARFVPFTREAVPEVDFESGRVVVILPAETEEEEGA